MLPLEHLHQVAVLAVAAEFVALACLSTAFPAAGDGVVDAGDFVCFLAALHAPQDVAVGLERAAGDNADGLLCLDAGCHFPCSFVLLGILIYTIFLACCQAFSLL